MGESVIVTGMVLTTMPISDYDKRITILTKERGRLPPLQEVRGGRTVSFWRRRIPFPSENLNFSKGKVRTTCRRRTSRIISGRLRRMWTRPIWGSISQFAEYFCHENNDETQMLKLLYQSLRALESSNFSNELVRVIFELKAMTINGEGPNMFACMHCRRTEELLYFSVRRGGMFCGDCKSGQDSRRIGESTRYTMQFIVSTPVEKLFTFQVSKEVLDELTSIMKDYLAVYVRHSFKSLQIIDELMLK